MQHKLGPHTTLGKPNKWTLIGPVNIYVTQTDSKKFYFWINACKQKTIIRFSTFQ